MSNDVYECPICKLAHIDTKLELIGGIYICPISGEDFTTESIVEYYKEQKR